MHDFQTIRTNIRGENRPLILHQSGEMTRFSPRCRTDIPNTLSRFGGQSYRRLTGGKILHHKPTFLVAGELIDPRHPLQNHRFRPFQQTGFNTRGMAGLQ